MAGTGYPVEAMALTCYELEGEGRGKHVPNHENHSQCYFFFLLPPVLLPLNPKYCRCSQPHVKNYANHQNYLSTIHWCLRNVLVTGVHKCAQRLETSLEKTPQMIYKR